MTRRRAEGHQTAPGGCRGFREGRGADSLGAPAGPGLLPPGLQRPASRPARGHAPVALTRPAGVGSSPGGLSRSRLPASAWRALLGKRDQRPRPRGPATPQTPLPDPPVLTLLTLHPAVCPRTQWASPPAPGADAGRPVPQPVPEEGAQSPRLPGTEALARAGPWTERASSDPHSGGGGTSSNHGPGMALRPSRREGSSSTPPSGHASKRGGCGQGQPESIFPSAPRALAREGF